MRARHALPLRAVERRQRRLALASRAGPAPAAGRSNDGAESADAGRLEAGAAVFERHAAAVGRMQQSVSVEDVLEVLTDEALAMSGAEAASATYVPEGGPEETTTVAGRAGARWSPAVDSPGPWSGVRRTNRPARLGPDELQGPGSSLAGIPERDRPRGGWMGIPLAGRDGRNAGILQLAGRAFGAVDEGMASALAASASIALENVRLLNTGADVRARLGSVAHVERVRAAELRAVISAIGDGVLFCDAHGEVTLANPAAERLLGGTVKTLDELFERFEGFPVGARGTGGPHELRMRHRPDLWVELRVDAVPAPGVRTGAGETAGRIAVLRDITAARNERAQREAFLGILSHELRTPITTIYAGSKVLSRAAATDEARMDLAADISSEAERLFRVVEDLIVMTRFERGVLDLAREPVLLQRVVSAAIRLERAHSPGTVIRQAGPASVPAVVGDALHVGQVVRNLLSNAAKYSPPGSEIEVAVEPSPDGVAVRVLDRGQGLPSDDAEDLFELFRRAPATAAHAAGAGIGLFVCRRLVTAMGGEIWARSRPGGGAEFGFRLRAYHEQT